MLMPGHPSPTPSLLHLVNALVAGGIDEGLLIDPCRTISQVLHGPIRAPAVRGRCVGEGKLGAGMSARSNT